MALHRARFLRETVRDHMDCFRYAVLILNLSLPLPHSGASRRAAGGPTGRWLPACAAARCILCVGPSAHSPSCSLWHGQLGAGRPLLTAWVGQGGAAASLTGHHAASIFLIPSLAGSSRGCGALLLRSLSLRRVGATTANPLLLRATSGLCIGASSSFWSFAGAGGGDARLPLLCQGLPVLHGHVCQDSQGCPQARVLRLHARGLAAALLVPGLCSRK